MFTNIASALDLDRSALLETSLDDAGITEISAAITTVTVAGWRRSESGVPVRNTAPAIKFEASFLDSIDVDGVLAPLHEITTVTSDHTNKPSLTEKYATDFRVAAGQLRKLKGATVGDVVKLIDAVARAVENPGSRYDKTVTNTGYAVIRAAAQR